MMKAFLTKKMVGSVIRHAMTAVGGAVVASGYADEATWQTITGGTHSCSRWSRDVYR